MPPARIVLGIPCRRQSRSRNLALWMMIGAATLPVVNAARVVAAEATVLAQAAAAQAPAAPTPQTPPAAAPTSLAAIDAAASALAARVTPAVVQILARGYVPKAGESGLLARRTNTGSGVVVGAEGYIVTNSHVVAGARTLQVQFPTEHRDPQATSILKTRGHVLGAQLVGMDRETDLAVLKIDTAALGEDSGKLPVLPFTDSDDLVQGQMVLAFGSPFGLES
jgi:S1-C subfamily serine protease